MVYLETIAVVIIGVFILRLSGRRSVSQMSIAPTVLTVSLGTLLIQPLGPNTILSTTLIALTFVATLIIIEYIQLKSRKIEQLISGKPKVVVENGQLNYKILRRLRMSEEKLQMHLRQKGIMKMSDLKTVILEINGQIGYEYNDDAKPLTMKDLKTILKDLGYKVELNNKNIESENMFSEVKNQQKKGE